MSHEVLEYEVLQLSDQKQGDIWAQWDEVDFEFESGGICACGHNPITERITIRNYYTAEELIVGNVCIQKFGIESKAKVFNSMRSIKHGHFDFPYEALDVYKYNGWISDWEDEFLTSYISKRRKKRFSPSPKQVAALDSIMRKLKVFINLGQKVKLKPKFRKSKAPVETSVVDPNNKGWANMTLDERRKDYKIWEAQARDEDYESERREKD